MFLAEDRTLCSLVRICSQTIWLNVLFSQQIYPAGFYVPLKQNLSWYVQFTEQRNVFYIRILMVIIYKKQMMYWERTSKTESAQAEYSIAGGWESGPGICERE